jgi:hypothetical protein
LPTADAYLPSDETIFLLGKFRQKARDNLNRIRLALAARFQIAQLQEKALPHISRPYTAWLLHMQRRQNLLYLADGDAEYSSRFFH